MRTMHIPRPHLLALVDVGWFGVTAGLGYYDINNDAFRPAFIEFRFWNRWRCSFEFGRVSSLWGRG